VWLESNSSPEKWIAKVRNMQRDKVTDMDTQSTGGAAAAARDTIREKGTQVRQELNDIGRMARDAATETFEDLRSRGMHTYEDVRNIGMDKARELEEQVRREPLLSIAIAAGVGYLLGRFVRATK
jgi:ElaB/YqjD/DUF883 family membrane-anchored ribosome-binding protein